MARLFSVAEIDARTPAGRNRYADALRVMSILVVVYGHWLLAVVMVRDGQLHGVDLLTLEPWTHWLTWVFQVMPIFFWVGGYANAAGLRSARREGAGWADWVRGRAERRFRASGRCSVDRVEQLRVDLGWHPSAGLRVA